MAGIRLYLFLGLLLALNYSTGMMAVEKPIVQRFIQFVQSPDKINFGNCRQNAHSIEYQDVGEAVWAKFLDQVSFGNEYAVKLAVVMLGQADGVLTEEISISLGTLVESRPVLLLTIIKEYRLPESRIRAILLNLGPRYVDKPEADIECLRLRREMLSRVNNWFLERTRDKCLRIIDAEIVHPPGLTGP